MKGFKIIQCEICGILAQVPAKRKIAYCNKKSCEKRAKEAHRQETYRKSNEKIKNHSREIKRIAEAYKNNETEEQIKTTNLVCTKVVNIDAIEKTPIGDIREIARELGTIRFRLIEMLQKEQEQIKQKEKRRFNGYSCV